MSSPPLPAIDSSAELRTCLRDLVSLLGLPALWSGRETTATVRILAETLVETLSLDVSYVSATLSPAKEPVGFLYANGRVIDAETEPDWRAFIDASSRGQGHDLHVNEEETPLGKLRVARFSLGYFGQPGQITAASSRPEFPKLTDLVLLRSAASLAASGLRTAQLTFERERALRAKDEFLAMLGHELRNPLAPIVTALELIKLKEKKASSKLPLEYTVIERQVNHLKGLVDDLLDITRITAGKVELKYETLELHSAVQTALEAAQPLIEERRHHVSCDIPENGLPVNGDLLRLSQVIANLLINAAKYTQPRGQIAIAAYRDGQHVSLKIKDTGTGISRDLLPYIFDLFEQGAVPIDRSHGGLGIGLTVVKSLVELHGGQVKAESAGAGLGSTFTVTLPLALQETVTAPAPPAPILPDANASERILVVDDNKDAANVMRRLLQAYGYEVDVQYSPLDALLACEKIKPTIVIVDIGLPVINGYELANLIRSRYKAPPRIMAVTGYGQPQDRQRSLDAGMEAHFTKPVQIEALLQTIRAQN
jgi:signal transduction histidine kinase/CheY-like chemotaxis protein